VTTHYDDEVQVEQLRIWWRENWKPLAAGLALGLGAILGWEAWNRHRDERSAEASRIYQDLDKAVAANKYDEAVAMGDKLASDFAGTPYAAAAALKLARAAVEANKLDDAQKRLAWATANAKDRSLRQLAALREARVLWQQGKTDEALSMLDQPDAAYLGLYAELRGDIRLAQGDRAAARAAYQEALQNLGDNVAMRDGLQRKLDDLADVVKS
jgi:predicted negative regulator of RcsB-dependent stress response